ncbi:MAG: hypothetical protein R3C30_13810 [Hyphomonadaceae bacterium]
MPIWIIAAIGSVVVTALLTFVLWRMNQPMLERNKRDAGGDAAPVVFGDGGRREMDYGTDDAGSDGGGGDGGGD